jgi:hypothetical protein
MSDVITQLLVQIKGDASGVVASFKELGASLTTTQTQVNVLDKSLKTAGEGAAGFRESVRSVKEPLDAMNVGLILFGDKIPGVGEALVGLQAGVMGVHAITRVFAIELATLVPYIGLVVAGLAGGMYAWHEWNDAEDESIKKAKDLGDAWKQLPEIIKDIEDQQKAGLLGPGSANDFLSIALGRTKLYVDAAGKITREAFSRVPVFQPLAGAIGGPATPGATGEMANVPNREATPTEYGKWLQDQMSAGGQVSKEYLESVVQLKEEIKKANEESLAGLEKQKAEIHDRYEKEREEIKRNLEIQRAQFGDVNFDNTDAAKAGRQALTQTFLNEQKDVDDAKAKAADEADRKQQETLDRLRRNRQEDLRQLEEAAAKQAEADTKHEDALRRQLELQQEIERAKAEAKLRQIQGDPFRTDQEKRDQSVQQYQLLIKQNAASISQLTALAQTTSDDAARLQAQRQITDLMVQQVDLQNKMNATAGVTNFVYQVRQLWTDIKNIQVTWQDVRGNIEQIAQSGFKNLNSQLAQVIVGTKTWHQALQQIGETMLTEIIDAILEIIEKELIVLAVDTAIKVVSGFASGGYTGDGPSNKIAGVVHAGEYVIPANRVNADTMPLLRALHSGSFADLAAPRSAGARFGSSSYSSSSASPTIQHNTSHYMYTDKAEMARQIEQDDAHEKWVIDVVAKNAYKLRS